MQTAENKGRLWLNRIGGPLGLLVLLILGYLWYEGKIQLVPSSPDYSSDQAREEPYLKVYEDVYSRRRSIVDEIRKLIDQERQTDSTVLFRGVLSGYSSFTEAMRDLRRQHPPVRLATLHRKTLAALELERQAYFNLGMAHVAPGQQFWISTGSRKLEQAQVTWADVRDLMRDLDIYDQVVGSERPSSGVP